MAHLTEDGKGLHRDGGYSATANPRFQVIVVEGLKHSEGIVRFKSLEVRVSVLIPQWIDTLDH